MESCYTERASKRYFGQMIGYEPQYYVPKRFFYLFVFLSSEIAVSG